MRAARGIRRLGAIAALVALAMPAAAGVRVALGSPDGKLLHGRGGLHAADSRMPSSLVRVISPGSPVERRGTIRVLVMNLGTSPFAFGPAQVTLRLPDGSELAKVPVREFRDGQALVSREMRRAAAADAMAKGGLAELSRSAGSGVSAQGLSGYAAPSAGEPDSALRLDRRKGEVDPPGTKTLAAIEQVLQREAVAPQEAAGGYLVFELPKAIRSAKADTPLTIVVKVGGEEHRFASTLRAR